MGIQDSGEELPGLSARRSTAGPLSILLGFLAILAVVAEYQILLYFWSGNQNPILQFLYLGLPIVTIVLAAEAQRLAREGMQSSDGNSVFGVIGLFVGVLAFLACLLLFALSCALSGRLIRL